jgi:hypothetical protein
MNTLIVNFDESKYKFTLYNCPDLYIGSFDVFQLMKYINQNTPKYLENVTDDISCAIIEKYICKIDCDTNLITLQNHIESQFMGDINLLLKLYKCVNEFIINNFETELKNSNCTPEECKMIAMCIKQFIFMLLCHSLKIIANITEIINDDPEKQQMKIKLMEYSIAIINKINTFMKIEFKKKLDEIHKLFDLSNKLTSVKSLLIQKIDKLNFNIATQNNKLDLLLKEINKIKLGEQKTPPISDYLFLPDTA